MSRTSEVRRYDGSGRQRDAKQRRRRVLEAATRLFLEQGYGATSIEQIGHLAETSPQSIYAVFGNKAGVLRRVIDVAVGGDDADVKLLDRPENAAIFELASVDERITMAAKAAARTHERSGELICLVERVSGMDPAVKALADDLAEQVRVDAQRFVDMVPATWFRPELTRDQIVDVAVLVGSAWMWHGLVVERGWTQQQYETWFEDTIRRLLLVDSGVSRGAADPRPTG